MKRLLVLFAKGFPYNSSEPFLENECPLYKEYFDKVLIVTSCKRHELPTRTVTDPTIEIICDHTLSKDPISILEALPYTLTDKMLYREFKTLFLEEGFSWKKFYELVAISLCANHTACIAYRWLKKHPEYRPEVLYSYWMKTTAYAALRVNRKLKRKCYVLSRVHRIDLYVERSATGYLPFHRQLFFGLDEIASISDDGKRDLEQRYGSSEKISVHRLGAKDQGAHNPTSPGNPFRIVTCSRTEPIKRVHRVLDALSQITDREIIWTHVGGGSAQKKLERAAAAKLPANVTVNFLGTIPNTKVYEMYRAEPFHVFINVSQSEGIPVSIMEAMSFDIPVIATAVGGTPELIDHGKNGYLLDEDFSDADLIARIRAFMNMPEDDYAAFRKSARHKFQREYSAIPNYRAFMQHLTSVGGHDATSD